MHAIGIDRPKTKDSIIFSTLSTHKMLAGLSQASQILVAEPENKKLNKSIVHGLVIETLNGIKKYYVDCVELCHLNLN